MVQRPAATRTLRPQPPPPGLYASRYDPALAAAICRRLAAGESLRAICRLDPAMPTEKTVWNWARSHPEFDLMKRHAQDTARARALAARAARDEARRDGVAQVRAARGWRPGGGRRSGYSGEVAETICEALGSGMTLAQACQRPGMPSMGTVYNWMRRRPEFMASYRLAREVAAEVLMTEATETSPWLGDEAASQRELRARTRTALRQASRLAPKGLARRSGPARLVVALETPGGAQRVIYGEETPPGISLSRRRAEG